MAPVDYALEGLAIAIFAGWCYLWTWHLVAIIYGHYKLYRKLPTILPDTLPGVSILKPLMGVDANLYDNLETFFKMDYPKYELLFCIADESDPAHMVVNSLAKKYPNVDISIFQGGQKVGINPKINNMMPGYMAAKYDLIMVSDSGLRMIPEALLDMVLHLKEDVGAVHQLPFVCDRKGFAGTLEKVYFGTHHARQYLYLNCLGINCTTGMSCLMRKGLLDEAGGIKVFGCYLAEDYFFAQMFIDRGLKIQLASYPALQNPGNYSVTNFQNRINRWFKLRFSMFLMNRLVEPLAECMLIGSLCAWAVAYLWDLSGLGFFFIHVLIWFLLDWILMMMMQRGPLPFSKPDFVVAWLFRECTTFYNQLRAISNPTIQWRGRKFRVKMSGIVEELKHRPKQYV